MNAGEDADSEASLSRSSSQSRTSVTELQKTLETLNLNKVPRHALPKHITTYHPYRPPAAVSWLVGTWKGKGKGIFPTIKDFDYVEECTFDWDETNPRPLLFYRQKTFSTKGNPPRPMHAESGYVRVIAVPGSTAQKIEFINTAPNGVSTVEEGTVEGHVIQLKLVSTTRSSTARPPHCTGLARTYTVDPTSHPPTLHYVVDMATTTTPTLTRHLEGMLTKWTDDGTSTGVTDDEAAP